MRHTARTPLRGLVCVWPICVTLPAHRCVAWCVCGLYVSHCPHTAAWPGVCVAYMCHTARTPLRGLVCVCGLYAGDGECGVQTADRCVA